MERSLGLLLMLIGTLAITHIVQAQSQEGFISLDCGLPTNETSPYIEEKTGLRFSSDATFIQRGKTGKVEANRESDLLKPHRTLRYFPDGRRNCYNLKVEKERKYLIRAGFVYGNYDGLDISPKFDLYIGPNLWVKIDLERVNGTREEILHIPTSDSLQICLVKNGTTTPMISNLELRPMGSNSYTTSASLKLYFRSYLTNASSILRFPNDAFDRLWTASFTADWTPISTTSNVRTYNFYEIPEDALTTAGTPTNPNAPLTLQWPSPNPDEQYHLYEHFAEIQDLQTNDTREFNILFNGKLIGTLIPLKLALLTSFDRSPHTCDGGVCSLQLTRTNRSTLPPLLNAIEVYTVIQFLQSETDENDVSAIQNIAATYALSRINWQGDPCVPQHLRWDGLDCSSTDTSMPPRITTLNLSSSGLNGNIAAAFQNLTQLEKLDLSYNNLTGVVPEFLGKMKSLLVINLSGNNLNGSLPRDFQSVEGNPWLFLRKPPKNKLLVPIVASFACAGIVIALLVIFLVLKKKNATILQVLHLIPRTSTSGEPTKSFEGSYDTGPPLMSTMNVSFTNKNSTRFAYSEVIKMTNNLERVLGKGGFGMVYHGTVNGSEQVAVKILSQPSTQGYKQFKAEVDLLLRVHHTNLVSLVGYCYEGNHLALVYEFLPNGDLKQHLSGKGGRSIINWSMRLRIALEAALGLEYLHIGCTPPMVHRDVKTANILLDENFKAKIADFGLSRSFQGGGESEDVTAVAGTPGYLDPEYFRTSRLSKKSDVYSFGIVLLEMITNQPVINQTSESTLITQWVGFKLSSGDITEIMDPNLSGVYDYHSAWRAIELAISCTDTYSANRPTMSEVISKLKECIGCENSKMSKNQGSESQEMSISMDTSEVPTAR